MAEFLLRLVEEGIRPPLGATLAVPAAFASWCGEEQRPLDEGDGLEGF
ncbi:hypothetical protein [Streptomyces sp. NPDC001076]